MPNHGPEDKASGTHLLTSLALVVLAIAAVVIIAATAIAILDRVRKIDWRAGTQ